MRIHHYNRLFGNYESRTSVFLSSSESQNVSRATKVPVQIDSSLLRGWGRAKHSMIFNYYHYQLFYRIIIIITQMQG